MVVAMVDRVGMDSTPREDTPVVTIATTVLPHSQQLVRLEEYKGLK